MWIAWNDTPGCEDIFRDFPTLAEAQAWTTPTGGPTCLYSDGAESAGYVRGAYPDRASQWFPVDAAYVRLRYAEYLRRVNLKRGESAGAR